MNQKQYLVEFEKLTDKMLEITTMKNKDYAGEDAVDPFSNFRNVEKLGIMSTEKGFLGRMTDKFSRIINLTEQEANVKDESIEDTLLDFANYCLLMLLYIKSKNEGTTDTKE